MRIVLAFFILLTMTMTGTPSHAAMVIGAGVDPCGKWSADRAIPNSPQALQDEQWALGYLSAVGQHGGKGADPLKGANASAVWTWIDKFCVAHPSAHIADAVEAANAAHSHP
jgi:hypothetical protein